jgi:hypothetical protein
MPAFFLSDWMLDRTTTEGSRIQSAEIKCDERDAQTVTIPATAAIITYAQRRWCKALMLAS